MVVYGGSYKRGATYLTSLYWTLVTLAFIGYVLVGAMERYGLTAYIWNRLVDVIMTDCPSEDHVNEDILDGLYLYWLKLIQLIRDPRMYGWYITAHFYAYLCLGNDGPVLLGSVTIELSRRAYRSSVLRIINSLRYIVYLGVHPTVQIPKTDPVRHPMSMFTASLFRLFAPERLEIARATYKRVNPTADIKLEALKKFDHAGTFGRDVFDDFIALAEESKAWEDRTLSERLIAQMTEIGDFSDVPFEGSSAAGYPFKPGTKRRDVAHDARLMASDLLNQLWHGDVTGLKQCVHYVTGRAKLLDPADNDAARLIIYQSFPTFLIMQKYAAPFTEWFVNRGPSWSAIGFSWFNGGADKLAKFFGLSGGNVPHGTKINSCDASSWDASLSAPLIRGVCAYHKHIIMKLDVSLHVRRQWCKILDLMYDHMIEAECVFPGGHTFKLQSGMKSGWNLTSIDNTIIHEVIFRKVMLRAFGKVLPHKLYGDDNIFMSPEVYSENTLVNVYAEYGIKIKYVHEGSTISDVDFLSKNIHFDPLTEHYYPYRPTVESDARMIMPEDFDPLLVPATDAVAAAEVIVGHLYDNFFNVQVRELCLTMLEHVRDNYDVQEVDPARAMRAYRHKGFGEAFRYVLPTVPDITTIFRLYGVPPTIQTTLQSSRGYVLSPEFSIAARVSDAMQAVVSEGFLRSVNTHCSRLGNRLNCIGRALTRPFRLTGWTAGTAGGKLLEALKRLNVKPSTLLDVGGHPGSVACTIINALPDTAITSVSSMYAKDVRAEQRFMYKAPIRDCDVRVQQGFEHFHTSKRFDHAHVDVTFDDLDMHVKYGDEASSKEWVARVRPMIRKALDYSASVSVVLPFIGDSVAHMLHSFLPELDDIDFFKPVFSHGWNTEVIVTMKKGIGIRMRFSSFRSACRSFRCKLSERAVFWAFSRMANASLSLVGQNMVRNPLHGDKEFQDKLIRQVTPSFAHLPAGLEHSEEYDETPPG